MSSHEPEKHPIKTLVGLYLLGDALGDRSKPRSILGTILDGYFGLWIIIIVFGGVLYLIVAVIEFVDVLRIIVHDIKDWLIDLII